MKFKTFQLIIQDDIPMMNELQKIADLGTQYIKSYYHDWYKVEPLLIEDNFLWFYVQYENSQLYGDTVLDGDADMEIQNTRPRTQVELKHQFFACYDIKSRVLYLSDYQKRGFMQHYLGKCLEKDVTIKCIYASLEEFEDNIRTLESISFVQLPDIYNREPGSMFQKQADLLGFGLPDKLKLHVFYGCNIDRKTKARLHYFKRMHDSNKFERIIMVGKDDNDIEQSYDFSTILEALEVVVEKDKAGRYNNDEVRRAFIGAVK